MYYRLTASAGLLLLSMSSWGQEPSRFIAKLSLPNGLMVMVAEGAFEASMMGSYSVRLYENGSTSHAHAEFLNGIVAPRDAPIASVLASQVCGDQQPDIIVHLSATDTKPHASAQAFEIVDNKLHLCKNVTGLISTQNPLTALLQKNQ